MSFCCVPRCNSVFEFKNSFFFFFIPLFVPFFCKVLCVRTVTQAQIAEEIRPRLKWRSIFVFLLLSLIIYIDQFHPKTTVFCFPADLISSATNKKYCRKHFDTVLTSLLWLCSGKVAGDAERQSGLSPCRTDSHL